MSALWDALRDAAEASGYELVEHSYRDTDPENCEEHTVWLRKVESDERA